MSQWFRTYGFGEVADGLVIGAYPLDSEDVSMLKLSQIERVLNLTEDEEYEGGARDAVEQALDDAGITEYRLRLTDYGGLPPDELEVAAQELTKWLDEGIRTYLHCRAGWQRSAAVAAAVVAIRNGIDIDEAVEYVRSRKPSADPLPHQREDLRRWWRERASREQPDSDGASN